MNKIDDVSRLNEIRNKLLNECGLLSIYEPKVSDDDFKRYSTLQIIQDVQRAISDQLNQVMNFSSEFVRKSQYESALKIFASLYDIIVDYVTELSNEIDINDLQILNDYYENEKTKKSSKKKTQS